MPAPKVSSHTHMAEFDSFEAMGSIEIVQKCFTFWIYMYIGKVTYCSFGVVPTQLN